MLIDIPASPLPPFFSCPIPCPLSCPLQVKCVMDLLELYNITVSESGLVNKGGSCAGPEGGRAEGDWAGAGACSQENQKVERLGAEEEVHRVEEVNEFADNEGLDHGKGSGRRWAPGASGGGKGGGVDDGGCDYSDDRRQGGGWRRYGGEPVELEGGMCSEMSASRVERKGVRGEVQQPGAGEEQEESASSVRWAPTRAGVTRVVWVRRICWSWWAYRAVRRRVARRAGKTLALSRLR